MEETLKDRHIERLRQGQMHPRRRFPLCRGPLCLERIADHCVPMWGPSIISHEGEKDGDFDRHEVPMRMIHKGKPNTTPNTFLPMRKILRPHCPCGRLIQ